MNESIKRQALEQIGRAIVMHKQFQAAHGAILNLVNMAQASKTPFGATVLGPPGTGKSTLAATVMQAIQSTDLLGERRQALYLSVQATPSVGQIIGSMLTALSFPPTIRPARVYDQSTDLLNALRERRIKLVFLNEGQHLTARLRTRSTETITDYMKLVIEETNIVIVVLATATFGHLKDINEQLYSRAPAYFSLEAFRCDDDWTALLQALSTECTAMRLDIIHGPLKRAVHKATGGLLRPLKQLLISAVSQAADRGLAALDHESLEAAFNLIFNGGRGLHNPFLNKAAHAAAAAVA